MCGWVGVLIEVKGRGGGGTLVPALITIYSTGIGLHDPYHVYKLL